MSDQEPPSEHRQSLMRKFLADILKSKSKPEPVQRLGTQVINPGHPVDWRQAENERKAAQAAQTRPNQETRVASGQTRMVAPKRFGGKTGVEDQVDS